MYNIYNSFFNMALSVFLVILVLAVVARIQFGREPPKNLVIQDFIKLLPKLTFICFVLLIGIYLAEYIESFGRHLR